MLDIALHNRSRSGDAPSHFIAYICNGPLFLLVITTASTAAWLNRIAHGRGVNTSLPVHSAPLTSHSLKVMSCTMHVETIIWQSQAL